MSANIETEDPDEHYYDEGDEEDDGGGGDEEDEDDNGLDDTTPIDESSPSAQHHTQLLDLTNGDAMAVAAAASAALDADMVAGLADSVTTAAALFSTTEAAATMEPSKQTGTFIGIGNSALSSPNSSTPGRVVETGQEHTGRWTKEEHEAFLKGLQLYGKEWKKVAAKVKTRTVVQTRTHAQKYFQKLQKTIEAKGGTVPADFDSVDMGVTTEPKKIAPYPSQQVPKKKRTPKQPQQAQRKPAKVSRRSSSTTLNAAQVISTLSSTNKTQARNYIAAASSSSIMMGEPMQPPPRHGFSIDGTGSFRSPMKIVAPDPNDARGRFPEPSPAATGKRKLAEIAAARMLAGVAAEGPPTPPPSDLKEPPPLPLFGGPPPPKLQIVNPATLGVTTFAKRDSDSPVTPWDNEIEDLVRRKMAEEDSSDDENNAGPPSLPSFVHPVNGPANGYGRSELHQAVCDSDYVRIQALVNASSAFLNQLDDAGFCPLHSACASALALPVDQPPPGINEAVRILLAAGTDPEILDSKGNTPLHWAARSGDKDATEQLIAKGDALNAKNHVGETPLHWAMRAGMRGIDVVNLLLENGARPSSLSKSFRRPIDVAAEGFPDDETSLVSLRNRDKKEGKMSREQKKLLKFTADERKDTRANLFVRSPQSRTLVLHHPECLEHHTKSVHDWEAPDRVRTIMRRIIPSTDPMGATESSGIFPHEVSVSQEFDRASLELLSRVHSTEYLTFVNKLSKDLEKKLKESEGTSVDSDSIGSPPTVVPFTPQVQRSMIKVSESSVKVCENSDTSFSAGSLRAARRAAGAVQHAVDCVLVGRNRNAFCVVRPPGHHAGINGLLEGGESCGFCIFNNIAAGALHAISDDKLLCNRCAIVDIDVHHGNGTEEIVRKCHDPSKLLFFSIHLYDNDRKKRGANQFTYKFYPGTGVEDDLALNIINVPVVPLWKDPTSSIAGFPAKTHNTRNKTRSAPDTPDDSSETSNPRYSSRASDVMSETGSATATSSCSRAPVAPSGRLAYRDAIQHRLLPALRAFDPDMILISAGFDACKGDVGNARHERGRERVGLDLEPEDYAWATRKILEIADICCQGKVVSVLEGGYGRTAPAALETGAEMPLDRTLFGECAIRHLHAMIDPYDVECRFSIA